MIIFIFIGFSYIENPRDFFLKWIMRIFKRGICNFKSIITYALWPFNISFKISDLKYSRNSFLTHKPFHFFFLSIHQLFWIDRYAFQNFDIQLGFSESKNIISDFLSISHCNFYENIRRFESAILFSENSMKDS